MTQICLIQCMGVRLCVNEIFFLIPKLACWLLSWTHFWSNEVQIWGKLFDTFSLLVNMTRITNHACKSLEILDELIRFFSISVHAHLFIYSDVDIGNVKDWGIHKWLKGDQSSIWLTFFVRWAIRNDSPRGAHSTHRLWMLVCECDQLYV